MYTCKPKYEIPSNAKLEEASILISQISLNSNTNNPDGLKAAEIAKSWCHLFVMLARMPCPSF
jgi:hypothetical protein